jgi:hypothetical protein
VPEAAVFVLSMQAVAGAGNVRPDGRRYDLLVFARGDDEGEAEGVARAGLAQLGWDQAAALRSGEITDPAAIPPDLEPTYRRALDQGCAVIVYDQP